MNWEIMRDKVFEFAFNEALNDATRRTAAASAKIEFVNDKEAYERVKGCIRKYADAVLDRDNKIKPDFYDVEKDVEGLLGKYAKFTFGNVQKLINMTMKYLYIACYCNENLRDEFKECHCPMDRIMKDRVVELCKKDDAAKELLEYEKDKKKTKNWSDVSWSTISKEDYGVYEAYQKMVKYLAKKDNLIPLEFDFKEFPLGGLN